VPAAGLAVAVGVFGLFVPGARATPPAAVEASSTLVGEDQAIVQAKASGQPVAVTAATSPTETVTANPDGTLTLTQAVRPVRKLVGGVWKDLDATLLVDTDGRITPAVATGDLHLSGGGTGPLATMSGGGRSLGLTLPFALPQPTLSGPTATYANVLPDVDLSVTGNTQGGFSEVLIVKNAAAAANPQLSTLTFATTTQGLALSSDSTDNLFATDNNHQIVATAPTPTMWDSAVPAGAPSTVTDPSTGAALNAHSGLAATSSTQSPGEGAHVAPLGVAVSPAAITLTPSATMLAQPGLTWPVYIDPTWSWGAAQNGYAVVQKTNPDRNYWKDSPSTEADLQSGLNPDGGDLRRTLVNFAIDTGKVNSTATIYSATLNITETWAYNCTASVVDVYGANAKMLSSSNATWNNWSGVSMTLNDQVDTAHGYNSGCPAAGVGFDVSASIKKTATANTKYQTFIIRADNESSQTGWKRWDPATPKITISYDHTPNQPTGLHTSPTTACTGSTIGDTSIKLYAKISDPDGGTLTENFTVWKDSNSSVKTTGSIGNVASGSSSSPFTVAESWLKANASTPTKFDWSLTSTQNSLTSKTSSTCSFTYDPTRPGAAATITPPASATIGSPATFQVSYTKSSSTDVPPASYQFQLNGAAVATTTADAAGNATITVTPMRSTNGLLVNGVSTGGNVSPQSAYTPFDAAAPTTPRADGDLTGDGNADLVAVGGVNGLPAGLWLAPGTQTGVPSVNPAANNIGAYGTGTGADGTGDASPAAFNGTQVITGHFSNTSMQDLLYYRPSDGSGGVLGGSGDGSVLNPNQDDAEHTIPTNRLAELDDETLQEYNPLVVANAGDSAANHTGFTDLIGITGNSAGYHLDYWPNTGGPVSYDAPHPLTMPSPDGTMDWNAWTIATAQRSDGSTAMYLWNRGTGALYLWTALAFTTDGNGDNTLTYVTKTLADGTTATFNKGATVTLRAADINHDGAADLWTLGGAAATTAWINTGTAMTGSTSQALLTSTHTWQIHEGPGSDPVDGTPIGTATDSTGSLPLTGSATGVTWNTGALFDPDATFTGGGDLTTKTTTAANPALATNADFSISVWVKPTANSQYVLSQDGTTESGVVLYISATNLWTFGMSQTDSATTVWDLQSDVEGTVQYNVWQHVTATYNKATGTMALYINGYSDGAHSHTVTRTTTGPFQIGDYQHNKTHTGYFKGELANVQVWNQTLTPDQVAALSGTPGYVLFTSDNTAYASGTTWKSKCATMSFSQGKLNITETCTKSATVSFGTTGYPNAILVLQTDGNLVIYKSSTDRTSLWSTTTYGHANDSMFLQPDGNLVIYAATGGVLWASGTNNP